MTREPDIVERLRACPGVMNHDPECNCLEAADEIERLRQENKQLRTLLTEARGPQGETHKRVAEWLRTKGYSVQEPARRDRSDVAPDVAPTPGAKSET